MYKKERNKSCFININLIATKKKEIERVREMKKILFHLQEMLKATAAEMFGKLLQIIRYLLNLCFLQKKRKKELNIKEKGGKVFFYFHILEKRKIISL